MHRFFLFVALVFACSTTLSAQAPISAVQPQRPSIRALRLATGEKITIDARLDEASWDRAVPITDFKQSEPHNGETPTERTEIRVIFDQEKLYIGAQFYDSEPGG